MPRYFLTKSYALTCVLGIIIYSIHPSWIILSCSGLFIMPCLSPLGLLLVLTSLPGILLFTPLIWFAEVVAPAMELSLNYRNIFQEVGLGAVIGLNLACYRALEAWLFD